MRKQKAFKRVSAWLLVWTMVLCTSGGGTTTWAEEPKEEEVQIEAQSEGEIGAETDAQIGEDTEREIEINAEEGTQDELGAQKPVIGFYKDTPSGEQLSDTYTYSPGETIYVVIDTDKISLEEKDYGIFLDGGESSERNWNAMVKPDTGDAAYTITIPDDCQEEFSILVWAGDEVECLKMVSDTNGLHAYSVSGKEFDSSVITKKMRKSITIDFGEIGHLCFWTVASSNPNSPQAVYKNLLKLYYFDTNATIPSFVPVTTDDKDKEKYGTIEACNETECGYKPFACFDLKKEGIYKVEADRIDGFVIIKTQYPELGLYTDSQVSEKTFAGIKLGGKYDYGSKESGRTVYLLKRDDVKGQVKGARAIWNGKDKTKEFITQEPVTRGLKITLDPDCQQDFDLQIDIEKEDGELEQKTIHFYDSYQPEIKNYDDGQPKKAFSGCMLTEWGFRSGLPWDEKNCAPVNRYWVHGDTVQEVLDKLTGPVSVKGTNEEGEETTVTIPNTGYYYITMSCYTGDADNEAKQKVEQAVTLPEGVKGVVMDSGSEQEVAWENAGKDFVNGRYKPIYEIDGTTYACYLKYEGDEVSKTGWYAAEWDEAAGIYVYNQETKEWDYKPEPGSKEWDRGSFGTCRIFNKDFSWPNLVLDVTAGHVPVKLKGKWLQDSETGGQAGVKIIYSNKKDTEFELDVCGRKITKENVAQPVIVKKMDNDGSETDNVITTVSFELEGCKHEGGTEKKDAEDPTCTETGHEDNTYCKDCGEKLEDGTVIPATGHSTEVRGKKDATCKEKGYTGDTYCKVCGIRMADGTAIEKTGHKWDAGKATKPATETEKGVRTYTCQNGCGQTKTEEIPLLEKKPGPKPEQPQQPQPKGTKIADASGNAYKVTSDPQAKEPTVEYTAPGKDAKGTVKVPDSVTIDGVDYKVTAIADNAFKGNKKVTKVTVGKNVIFIGKNAFSGCTKLKNVTIGASVMEIGATAFKGCAALTKITLPAKVQKIGKNAFAGCKKLKTIIIKSTKLTAKSVSKGAFKGLTAKTTIKVPKSKLKAYKKLFQSKGLPKKVKVKA